MKKILAGIAVLAVAAVAQADLLASWNFTGKTGSDWGAGPLAADELGDNVGSASLKYVADGDIAWGTAGNSLRVNGSTWGGNGTDATTAASYFDVSLNAASGYELTVEEIDMRVNGSSSAVPNKGQAVWMSGGQAISEAWGLANSTGFKPTLTANPSGSSVNLRLLATMTATGGNWGFTGAGTTGHSLAINGSTKEATAVPEPATMSLLGLGALAMVIRRKLRK